jgi:hypothetical protein
MWDDALSPTARRSEMIKRRVTLVMLTFALSLGLPAAASAQTPSPSERACLGTFHSSVAGPSFAEFVPFIAQEFHPLGQTVSYEATTCDILFD